MKLKEIYLSSCLLVEFRDLKDDFVVESFLLLLKTLYSSNEVEDCFEAHSKFVYNLKKAGYDDFSLYLKDKILKFTINDKELVENELKIICGFSEVEYSNIKSKFYERFSRYSAIYENLAVFKNSGLKLTLKDFEDNLNKTPDDIYKNNRAFIFNNNLEIEPVQTDENIKFSDLKGYVEQKRVLKENTKALLNNLKVNNILLYGDAGCGKSSSVRALLSEFEDIKIVQIFKNNLINLDKLYEKLRNSNHKFIIFADDISFDETDTAFSTMKAVLEGSLIQCPKNAVIYATSNRRHLVKETFQARCGDEIHLNDTMNEISSLSERFGINLLFSKPTNDEFNDIVLKLAADNNIEMDEVLLIEKAQKLALIKGTRSPRVARQLIDNLIARVVV